MKRRKLLPPAHLDLSVGMCLYFFNFIHHAKQTQLCVSSGWEATFIEENSMRSLKRTI